MHKFLAVFESNFAQCTAGIVQNMHSLQQCSLRFLGPSVSPRAGFLSFLRHDTVLQPASMLCQRVRAKVRHLVGGFTPVRTTRWPRRWGATGIDQGKTWLSFSLKLNLSLCLIRHQSYSHRSVECTRRQLRTELQGLLLRRQRHLRLFGPGRAAEGQAPWQGTVADMLAFGCTVLT